MYKAIHALTNQEFIILNPYWARKIEYLRSLDQQDLLVCQFCRQPLRVRAGNLRRWHFAHKHLSNCPFQEASPELLEARALLYEWLAAQFGPDVVTLEKRLADSTLPRAVDGWVERPGALPLAYWIIEARLNPQARKLLLDAFHSPAVLIHWILLAGILHEDEKTPGLAYLSTTERAFAVPSIYDRPLLPAAHASNIGALHYLDAEQQSVITYRALRPTHATQAYQGYKMIAPLAEILAAQNGELVQPGEDEPLQDYLQQFEQVERERQENLRKTRAIFRSAREQKRIHLPPPGSLLFEQEEQAQAAASPQVDRLALPVSAAALSQANDWEEAACIFCGQLTTDYWYLDRKTKRCKCRECLARGEQ